MRRQIDASSRDAPRGGRHPLAAEPGEVPLGMVLLLLLAACLAAGPSRAGEPLRVRIADPYIELRTGAGRGYPVFHVEERGRWIEIIKRRTDWFKVRTEGGRRGWVGREQLERTLAPTGERIEVKDAALADFAARRWEIGGMGGDFEGANVLTVYGAFALSPTLSAELALSQALGEFSDSDIVTLGLVTQPWPQWRYSPFFTVAGGQIRTDPRTALVQDGGRRDEIAGAGVGLRIYLAREFFLRAEYRSHVIFQDEDDNQEIEEWKLGFGFFF